MFNQYMDLEIQEKLSLKDDKSGRCSEVGDKSDCQCHCEREALMPMLDLSICLKVELSC